MGLRINTNVASLAAQRHLNKSQRETMMAQRQLASGSRFGDPAADAAGFTISEHLRGQIAGQKAANYTAENAISVVQVAEGGLNEQNNILIRLRELAIQAASDTNSDVEREFIDKEYQNLTQELDRIAKTTQFGSQKLLSGKSKTYEFQVGPYAGPENIVKYTSDTDTQASSLGVDGLSISDKGDARSALSSIDSALTKIAEARSHFGAIQSRFQSIVNNNSVQIENLTAAHSRMADTDVAEAVSKMTKGQILQNFQAAVLAQANSSGSHALKIIGSI